MWFHEAGDWSGTLEVVGGHLLEIGGLGFGPDDRLGEDASWSCRVHESAKGVQLRVLSAVCAPDAGDPS